MFDPALLGPCVDVLASLAGDGAALEFAVGTGRVGLPLSARGVRVTGIEMSPGTRTCAGADRARHREAPATADPAAGQPPAAGRLTAATP